jgi:hypothetical protein
MLDAVGFWGTITWDWLRGFLMWLAPHALKVSIWANIALAYITHGTLLVGVVLCYVYGRKPLRVFYSVLFVSYTIIYLADIIAEAHGVEYVKGYREPRLMMTRLVILWGYLYLLYRMVRTQRLPEPRR